VSLLFFALPMKHLKRYVSVFHTRSAAGKPSKCRPSPRHNRSRTCRGRLASSIWARLSPWQAPPSAIPIFPGRRRSMLLAMQDSPWAGCLAQHRRQPLVPLLRRIRTVTKPPWNSAQVAMKAALNPLVHCFARRCRVRHQPRHLRRLTGALLPQLLSEQRRPTRVAAAPSTH
jgi:hypothetical protein